jgi:hippurate hydrolase
MTTVVPAKRRMYGKASRRTSAWSIGFAVATEREYGTWRGNATFRAPPATLGETAGFDGRAVPAGCPAPRLCAMIARVTSELHEEARALLPGAVALRRRLHQQPELGLELPATQQAVLEALDGLPLAVETGSRTTSVLATLEGGKPGPTILLRGDMDALPLHEDTGLEFASRVGGAMHACGHDAHVAMLAGAARLLAARRAELPGRIVFMFQPGEEGHFGARVMLEEGLLEREHPPCAAFAIHAVPTIRAGVIATRPSALLASNDDFAITIRGRGGHASMPHDALDPIPVACEVVQALQTYVTRRVNAFEPAVVTVAHITAGTTFNVIPETAKMRGTIRTVSERTRKQVVGDVRGLVEGIARAHGASAELRLWEGYPVTANDQDFARFTLDVARDLLGERRAAELPNAFMGAEDFSYVLERLPGAMVFLGVRPDGVAQPAPNHSNRMVLDEDALATGIAMHAAVAREWLGRAAVTRGGAPA